MQSIFAYIFEYYSSLNKKLLGATSLLVAILIYLNYSIGIEPIIRHSAHNIRSIMGFFLLYSFIFTAAYWLRFLILKEPFLVKPYFLFILLAAPAIFALKIGINNVTGLITSSMATPWDYYWNIVLDWPIRFVFVLLIVILLWRLGKWSGPAAGLYFRGLNIKPYLILLAIMLPLVLLAAMQADFLAMYPKLQRIASIYPFTRFRTVYQSLFELSYGVDFIGIETFFRGFLVLAFARFAGKDAILPMAAFYCSIHFGKPLFECISSFPGGIILGVIVYNTRSIWGGLMVHLGVAWMMELAAYAGHHWHI